MEFISIWFMADLARPVETGDFPMIDVLQELRFQLVDPSSK
jgi:hypothetical protein